MEPTIHITGCYLLGQLLVDNDVWASVPQDLKDIIAACVAESRAWCYDYLTEQHNEGRDLFEAAGVETIHLADGEAEKAKIIGGENLNAYWGNSELTDEFLELYCDWLSSKGGGEIVTAIKGE